MMTRMRIQQQPVSMQWSVNQSGTNKYQEKLLNRQCAAVNSGNSVLGDLVLPLEGDLSPCFAGTATQLSRACPKLSQSAQSSFKTQGRCQIGLLIVLDIKVNCSTYLYS